MVMVQNHMGPIPSAVFHDEQSLHAGFDSAYMMSKVEIFLVK